MTKRDMPLVTVIVCTYNSSKYVIETLESAKAQTYENIELIVSDDCSTDNSVEICREWLDNNQDRFTRVDLLTVENNTGVSANANRTLKIAKGEWIKYIAGDDMLLPDCIEKNMNFIDDSGGKIAFLFSRYKYLVDGNFVEDHPRIKYYNAHEQEFRKSARGQFLSLIRELFACPPTVFMHRETLNLLQGFDEDFSETDDYPLFLKATSSGYKFYFMPVETVIYRHHDSSLSEQYYKKWVYIDKRIIDKYFSIKYRFIYPLHYLDFILRHTERRLAVEGKKPHGKLFKLMNPLAILKSVSRKIGLTS